MYQLPTNVATFVSMHTFDFAWNSGSGVMLSVMRDVWRWNKLCGGGDIVDAIYVEL